MGGIPRAFWDFEQEVYRLLQSQQGTRRMFPLVMFIATRRFATDDNVPGYASMYRWNYRRRTKAELGKKRWRKDRRDNFDLRPGTKLYLWRKKIGAKLA